LDLANDGIPAAIEAPEKIRLAVATTLKIMDFI